MSDFLTWLRGNPYLAYGIPAVLLAVGVPAWLAQTSSPYVAPMSALALTTEGKLAPPFVATVIAIAILALCGAVACIGLLRALFRLRRSSAEAQARYLGRAEAQAGERESDFERFTSNARAILNRLDKRPNCETEQTRIAIHIFDTGDVEYRRSHRMRANNEKTVFHAFYEESDASAPPAATIGEVSLTARSLEKGRDVILLPTENSTHRKEFALCFLPPLSKGQVSSVEICHRWPGYCRDLVLHGRTSFFWQIASATPGKTMDLVVELHFPQSMASVSCEIGGVASDRARLDRRKTTRGDVVWTLRDGVSPVGSGDIGILCLWPKPRRSLAVDLEAGAAARGKSHSVSP